MSESSLPLSDLPLAARDAAEVTETPNDGRCPKKFSLPLFALLVAGRNGRDGKKSDVDPDG